MYLYMSPIRAFIFPRSQCGGHFDDAVTLVKDMMDKYKDYEPEDDNSTSEAEGKED